MSHISAAEMEMKRQQMVTSIRNMTAAMRDLIEVSESYANAQAALPPMYGGMQGQPGGFGSMPMTAMPDPMHANAFAQGPVTATMHQTVPPPTYAGNAVAAPSTPNEEKKKPGRPPKDGSKEKKIKDPNAPKRPASAYIHFQNDVRDEIRKIHPNLPYKEILTLIADKWKKLPSNVKKGYEDTYQEQKGAYRLLDDAYKAGGPGPTPTAKTGEVVEASDSSDSDSESSDSDATPNPPVSAKKPASRSAAPAPQSTPQVPHVTSVSTPTPASTKKEKKRKSKDDEPPVAATPDVGSEKKKSKKKKDGAA